MFASFPQTSGNLKKTEKKVFAHKFTNFPQSSCVKIFFLQVLKHNAFFKLNYT